MILDDIRATEFDQNRSKLFGIKSGILWGHSNKNNSMAPLLYLSRPNHLSQEDFEAILSRVEIRIKESPNDPKKP